MASIALVRAVASQAGRVLSGGAQVVGRISRGGAGRAIASGVAGGAAIAGVESLFRGGSTRRRPRRRGVSASDISAARRVMALVQTFGYKPKLPLRRKSRKRC